MLQQNKGDINDFLILLQAKRVLKNSDISIRKLIYFINDTTFCYFRGKENNDEFLAVGIDKEASSVDSINTITDYLFGSMNFDFNDTCTLFSPILLIKKTKESEIILLKNKFDDNDLLEVFSSSFFPKNFTVSNKIYSPDLEKWKKDISDIKNAFTDKLFKVVLSRSIKLNTNSTHWKNVLKTLEVPNMNNSYEYILNTEDKLFYSISPESLYKRDKNNIKVDAIAGTTSRGNSDKEDQEEFDKLKNDQKEIKEHLAVCEFIESTADKLNLRLLKKSTLQPLKLKYIQHLFTQYSFCLSEGLSDKTLVKNLHPTPAVGGNLQKESKDIILKTEKQKRGFYAGPSGYIDFINNKSDFLVAIRSFEYAKNGSIKIQAGAGILKDSIDTKEWNETTNKMKNFLTKLNNDKTT
jgi:isochorismate synthase EntC